MRARPALFTALALVATTLVGYGVASAQSGGGSGPTPRVAARPAPISPHGVIRPDASAVIHPPNSDSRLVNVPLCRLASTAAAKVTVKPGHTVAFATTGTDLSQQGGAKKGCGVPANATAVELRVAATGVSKSGKISLYPTGTPNSTAAVFYTAHQASSTGLTQQIATGNAHPLTVKNFAGNADFTIYVSGYYVPEIEGLIYTGSSAGTGYDYSGSTGILSVDWVATGVADVTVDRDVTYCTPMAGGYYGSTYYADAKAFNANEVRVFTWYLDTTSHQAVPVNNYLNLTVDC